MPNRFEVRCQLRPNEVWSVGSVILTVEAHDHEEAIMTAQQIYPQIPHYNMTAAQIDAPKRDWKEW